MVEYERTGPVAVVTIDRPERRNAIDAETADALRGAWRRFDGDEDALVDGGTQRLPRIVGLGRALELVLTGRPIGAEEAREWGLVNRVVDDGEALEAAVELGETIAAFPQRTVRTDRRAVYEGIGSTFEQGLAVEAAHGSRALQTAEEGAERFASGEGRGGEGVPDR